MRTSIRLPDDIVIEATSIAARTGRTLDDVVEEAVRDSFARRRQRAQGPGPSLPPPFGDGGLRPGLDLDGTAALLDIMDGTIR